MAKAYIFLADGFEEVEALTVVDFLRRAQIDISMVSITGDLKVTGSHQITVVADMLFGDGKFEEADLLILPGGMPGTTALMNHEGLDKLLRDFHGKNKTIAAICAAPSVLGTKGLLEGKRATCYPGFESKLKGCIATGEDVVIDGNIITSKGPGTAMDFALTLISVFKDKGTSRKIAEGGMYKHYN